MNIHRPRQRHIDLRLGEPWTTQRAFGKARIDLDVGHFSLREPEVQQVELLRQRQAAVVREGQVLASRPLTAQRYAAAMLVRVLRRAGAPSPVDDALAALGLSRDVALTVSQAHVSAIVAARSDLVATLSEQVAEAMAPGLCLRVLAESRTKDASGS